MSAFWKRITDSSDEAKVCLASILYWVVFGGLTVISYPCFIFDAMARYAPMADAFARGDWYFAFHPRFGVLFQVLSGSVSYVTGLSGEYSVQIVSTGFVALAAIPLWHLMRKAFDAQTAWWAVALLWVSDDFTRYAMDGLRDPGKLLAFALIGLGVLKRKSGWFALGLFVLATMFSYGYAIAAIFSLAWCVWAWCRKEWARAIMPILSMTAATGILCAMVHFYTGHWLPIPHLIRYLGDVL